jgi:hypothetical protein
MLSIMAYLAQCLCCIALQAAVQQTLVVLQAMLAELSNEARTRLLTSSPPSKVALFNRPEQVWTDVPEHSGFKNTTSAYEYSGTSSQQLLMFIAMTAFSFCAARILL